MKKKRGAPSGNPSASKHGFYTRSSIHAEKSASTSNLHAKCLDEILLLRRLIARLSKPILEEKSLSLEELTTAFCTVTRAMEMLSRLMLICNS
jgi:hypothetical protein